MACWTQRRRPAGSGAWNGCSSAWGGCRKRPSAGVAVDRGASYRAATGNRAFDEYRAETLRRLEDEQREFMEFLDRLRHAKDKAEFDEFMAERRRRSAGTDAAAAGGLIHRPAPPPQGGGAAGASMGAGPINADCRSCRRFRECEPGRGARPVARRGARRCRDNAAQRAECANARYLGHLDDHVGWRGHGTRCRAFGKSASSGDRAVSQGPSKVQ